MQWCQNLSFVHFLFAAEQAYRLNYESARIARRAADDMTAKSGIPVRYESVIF